MWKPELKEQIRREYINIYNLTKFRRKTEVIAAWRHNRKVVNRIEKDRKPRENVIWGCYTETSELQGKSNRKKRATIKLTQYACSKVSVETCPIRVIYPLKATPLMTNWAPIQQNFLVEDETELTHIPYTDVKDANFVNELIDSYDGEMHGVKDNAKFDHEIFVDLVMAMSRIEEVCGKDVKKPPGREITCAGTSYASESITSSFRLPSSHVFKAISEYFFDERSDFKIKEEFIKAYQKINPSFRSKGSDYLPDINEPNAISTRREDILNSYASLFCRRCFKYDCFIHKEHIGPTIDKRKKGFVSTEMCGPHCFKNLGTAHLKQLNLVNSTAGGQIKKNREEHSKTYALANTLEEGDYILKNEHSSLIDWSASEQNLLQVLYPVYLDNYCVIAEMLMTKTCHEVYLFAKGKLSNALLESQNQSSGNKKSLSKLKRRTWNEGLRKIHRRWNGLTENVNTFVPCYHPGMPCDTNCFCIEDHNFCEKFCRCDSECENRFPGCRCIGMCNTKKCPCYLAVRECDPDLCHSCGASERDIEKVNCKNINIQRGLRKHLLMGPSDVAGWGVFLKEPVHKKEFIYEYCGELISHDESERRGAVYDKLLKGSYLFTLNNDLVIDATRKGNKIRFANHSAKKPNCYAKVLMVNGDHRIGIFAKNTLQAHEELFFDYCYGPNEKLKFIPRERE